MVLEKPEEFRKVPSRRKKDEKGRKEKVEVIKEEEESTPGPREIPVHIRMGVERVSKTDVKVSESRKRGLSTWCGIF